MNTTEHIGQFEKLNTFFVWFLKNYEDAYRHCRHIFLKDEGMLIGYMEEYLITEFGVGVGNSSDVFEEINKGKTYVSIRFNQLVDEIERHEEYKKIKEK